MHRRILGPVLLASLMTLASGTQALAVPLLQLDIAGGVYDPTTQTIVATSNPFTLYALATPQGSVSADNILGETYYISMAIMPQVGPLGVDLGYFTVNGQTVNVTSDMVYGKPPIEVFEELQGGDRGDLVPHGIYPTYFTEFAFQFSAGSTTPTYNTQDGSTAPGTSFIHEFVIDTSGLNPEFVVHFDLYDTKLRNCGQTELLLTGNDPECQDVDTNHFAPFSHDAQSPPVPEPVSIVLFGTGLAAGALRRFKQKRHGQKTPIRL